MLIKKVAFAAVLALAFTSLAQAQGGEWGRGTGQDSNAGNVIPLMNEPGVYGYNANGGLGMLLPSRAAAIETARVALQTSNVALTRPMVRRAVIKIVQNGPYREGAVALGMSRLYGRSMDTYQTAAVGLYGAAFGMENAQVALTGRPFAAARIHRRAAIRSSTVGLRRGIGAGSVEPLIGGGGY